MNDILRPYQQELVERALPILETHNIVYLAFEMRVGKSLTSMALAERVNAKSVLFVTEKSAISSIEGDCTALAPNYTITITNYERLRKIGHNYDLIIIDEAHGLGKFPKPSLRAQQLRRIASNDCKVIYLSGTPTPESFSQIFHQLWITPHSPFPHKTFYKWAAEYVTITQKRISGGTLINDYSNADQAAIELQTKHLFVTKSQKDAGFENYEVFEEVQYIKPDPRIHDLARAMTRHSYYKFSDGTELVAETAVSLQSKLHQIYSGTVITGDEPKILDTSKAKYIYNTFTTGQYDKIAVFYKYQAERAALERTIPRDLCHTTPEAFNSAQRGFYMAQIAAGSQGVNLASADVLLFYNISFSSMHYWQSRARIQSLERPTPAKVIWLFTEGGIEEKIYKAVLDKRNYTLRHFTTDYHLTHKPLTNTHVQNHYGK